MSVTMPSTSRLPSTTGLGMQRSQTQRVTPSNPTSRYSVSVTSPLCSGANAGLVGGAVVGVDAGLPGRLLVHPLRHAAQQALQGLADPDVADVLEVVEQLHLVHVHAGGRSHAPKQRGHRRVLV